MHLKPRPQSTNYCCGVFKRAASIRLMDGRLLDSWTIFEGDVYIRKYGT